MASLSVHPLGEFVPSLSVFRLCWLTGLWCQRRKASHQVRPWSLCKLKALAASSHRTLHADRLEAQKRGAIPAEAPDPKHHQGWDRYYMGAVKNTSGTQVIHRGALSVLSCPVLSTGAKPHPAKGTGTRGLPHKASHREQQECRLGVGREPRVGEETMSVS